MTDARGVAEISEQALITDVQARLTATYADVSADDITALVYRAHARFDECPIRDFVPLLVERRVRAELDKGDVPALAAAF